MHVSKIRFTDRLYGFETDEGEKFLTGCGGEEEQFVEF
jgi:hypothetical protein